MGTTTTRRKAFRVAGVTFAPGYPANLHRLHPITQDAWSRGEPVACVLRRNPQNQYDANAIEIHVPALGTMVGHVPADLAARLAPLLDQGARFHAEVWSVAIDPEHPDRPGLTVSISEVER